jgi:SsrA-binding protein
VPLKAYWKDRKIKILLGVGEGKNQRDKRQDLKKADDTRQMDRMLKARRS